MGSKRNGMRAMQNREINEACRWFPDAWVNAWVNECVRRYLTARAAKTRRFSDACPPPSASPRSCRGRAAIG